MIYTCTRFLRASLAQQRTCAGRQNPWLFFSTLLLWQQGLHAPTRGYGAQPLLLCVMGGLLVPERREKNC